MRCEPHPTLPEIVVIDLDVFRDDRGYFLESYHSRRYGEHGLPERFVQDNISFSRRGVLRGLHYQLGAPQGKLVWPVLGEIYDVAVDIRKGSPTFGQWAGVALAAERVRQVYVPDGFAHGFCVTSETALVAYKCTDYYAPREERGIRWDDPSLGIAWPIAHPTVSKKDAAYAALAEIAPEDLPGFSAT